MRSSFIIFFIVIIVSLSAQFTNPLNINGLGEITQSSGQNAYRIVDETVYITYLKEYIYFTKITNNNNQTHKLVDALLININQFTIPAIEVMDNGDIVIVYSEVGNTSNNFLKVATSIDDGLTFDIDIYLLDCFKDPQIAQRNGELDICYSNALPGNDLTDFMYFTDTEKSENEDGGPAASILKFWGEDELDGPMHSNDDIWIQNVGGWPTFHGMVTTAGRIMDFATGSFAIYSVPMENVFLGGYAEEVSHIEFNPSAALIRQNGLALGYDGIDIVYVKLADGAFESMFGEIVQTGIDTVKVYSWFPHNAELTNLVIDNGGNWFEDSDHIYTNTIAHYDTIWTAGPSFPVVNQSVWVGDAELWIEGEVYGPQTWGCADTVFITGDITYHNTLPGNPPDDPDNMNITDYFGLVSEKKILIKYKHKDPFNNMEICDDNCSDIMLYGAYAAICEGDESIHGNMACHYDGIITYEYQHPHGSTPDFAAQSAYTMQDTLYTNIDLHKYIFPPNDVIPPEISGFNLHGGDPIINTCGFPWEDNAYITSYPNSDSSNYAYPYGTDYPWYNPVWPESSDDIVFERGDLTIFGSFLQRRRGAIHRSGMDPYNHPGLNPYNPGDNEWDMDEYHFDGHHGSTGYGKDYHYDSRLAFTQPPDFPSLNQNFDRSNDIRLLHSSNNGQSFSESYVEELDGVLLSLWMDSDGENLLIAYQQANEYNTMHFLVSNYDPQIFQHYFVGTGGNKLQNAHIYGDYIYAFLHEDHPSRDEILVYQISTQEMQWWYYDIDSNLSDFLVSETGDMVYVYAPEYDPEIIDLDFRYNNGNGSMQGFMNWNYLFGPNSNIDSKVSVRLEDNRAYTTILKDIDENGISMGELYLISGELEGMAEVIDEEFISPEFYMQIFPNPFNPETTISFSLTTESTEDTEINIYNVKGQKVKTFQINPSTDQLINSVTWNGTDTNGKSVSTGVYLFELKADGKLLKTKKGLLLK